MMVEVEWRRLRRRHPLWRDRRCLYAYVDPRAAQILYIGEAGYQTIGQRLHGAHKDEIFRFCEEHLGVGNPAVLHGRLQCEDGRRRSSELLADVESLLIMRLQPPLNIAYTRSRRPRPGLRVQCTGTWPHRRTGFHDV
jgi:hypothetical protein